MPSVEAFHRLRSWTVRLCLEFPRTGSLAFDRVVAGRLSIPVVCVDWRVTIYQAAVHFGFHRIHRSMGSMFPGTWVISTALPTNIMGPSKSIAFCCIPNGLPSGSNECQSACMMYRGEPSRAIVERAREDDPDRAFSDVCCDRLEQHVNRLVPKPFAAAINQICRSIIQDGQGPIGRPDIRRARHEPLPGVGDVERHSSALSQQNFYQATWFFA
jgi:hypothetical protein